MALVMPPFFCHASFVYYVIDDGRTEDARDTLTNHNSQTGN